MVRLIVDLVNRGLRRGGVFVPVVLLACVLARASWAESHLAAGRTIYNHRCYVCHGYSGDAHTLAARLLQPAPRDFTGAAASALTRDTMIEAVTHGRPGTAMQPFAEVLSPREIAAVVDFIRSEFMEHRHPNTRYHTAANGWPDHERYAAAYPFATGALPLDTPWAKLSARQRAGRRLFFTGCISCHDRSHVNQGGAIWERQALSYPRFQFRPGDAQRAPDAVTGATPFARHDIPRHIADLTPRERRGEALYLANCAFCHAADGTGENWIGRFLEPHPRNLTGPAAMAHLTRDRLRQVIREGLPGTSMPAWGEVLDEAGLDAVIAYIGRAFRALPADAGGQAPRRPAGSKTP